MEMANESLILIYNAYHNVYLTEIATMPHSTMCGKISATISLSKPEYNEKTKMRRYRHGLSR